jgi:hypothetical protein
MPPCRAAENPSLLNGSQLPILAFTNLNLLIGYILAAAREVWLFLGGRRGIDDWLMAIGVLRMSQLLMLRMSLKYPMLSIKLKSEKLDPLRTDMKFVLFH